MYESFHLPNGETVNILRKRTRAGTSFYRVAVIPAIDADVATNPTRDFTKLADADAYAEDIAQTIV